MKREYILAVIGATGVVGTEVIKILNQRNFPIKKLYLIASKSSEAKKVYYNKLFGDLSVVTIDKVKFKTVDIVIASAGSEFAKEYLSQIAKVGPVVIDNSSYFRTDKDIPLIIPEINLQDIYKYKSKNIIANPNCSTIAMLMPLAPLHNLFNLKRVVCSTYQAVSGAGSNLCDSLKNQTEDIINNKYSSSKVSNQIAFNIIPSIDTLLDNFYTKEEWKMNFETKKILNSSIKVSATCVRVPVFTGHCLSINAEFHNLISYSSVIKALSSAKGVIIKDEFVTPIEVAGKDEVFISRVRLDHSNSNTVNLWVCADNLRKGAALNAVQIAEELIKIN